MAIAGHRCEQRTATPPAPEAGSREQLQSLLSASRIDVPALRAAVAAGALLAPDDAQVERYICRIHASACMHLRVCAGVCVRVCV